eukprot:TRINITY_DN40750_c0_g1_i1.p1 TRINITY_DN40750_c0_g1~~TRINITY_DN40750_c0_g1_i1.p1  ORF type:complete len:705 (+),score=148.78 TRINITY_DN40750_c0_g1_i1:131-2245(+)
MDGRKQNVSPDIRFSDVAHYVGLSLMKAPPQSMPQLKSSSSVRLSPMKKSQEMSRSLSSPGMRAAYSPKDDSHVQSGYDSSLRTQLEWLRAEQKAELEQLKRMEGTLADSLVMEKKAKQKVQKQQEMRNFHAQKCSAAKQKIASLQAEIRIQKQNMSRPQTSQTEDVAGEELPLQASIASSSSAMSKPKSPKPMKAPKAVPGGDIFDDEEDDLAKSAPSRPSRSRPESTPAVHVTSMVDAGILQPEHQTPIEDNSLKGYFDDRETNQRMNTSTMSGAGSSHQRSMKTSRSDFSTMHSRHSEKPVLSPEELAALQELNREAIRRALIESAGSEKEAFKKLDTNGSGRISLQEFADGVARQGVDWQEITQLKKPRDLFKLFDLDRDGLIIFSELFPEVQRKEPERCTTPEFWNSWCKRNRGPEFNQRQPTWTPADPEAELALLFETSSQNEEAGDRRKWMAATIKRLKNRGKSDARCREIVSKHLPRGTGPKDREDVETFSAQEVKACKKTYMDRVNDPVRNIQKVVYDMREQRRVLHDFRQKLWTVTMEPVMRKQMEEDRKQAAQSVGLGGLSLGIGGGGGDSPAPAAAAASSGKSGGKSMQSIAQECRMDLEAVEDLSREYMANADKNEILSKKAFKKLLQALCPGRTLSESDIDAWWEQVKKVISANPVEDAAEDSPGGVKKKADKCHFEHFAVWYASSEARQ